VCAEPRVAGIVDRGEAQTTQTAKFIDTPAECLQAFQ